MAIYVIRGSDNLAVERRAKACVEKHCPPDRQAYGLETYDSRVDTVDEALQVLGRIMEALNTVGFMGEERVVWIKEPSFLGESVLAKSESVKPMIQKLTEVIKENSLSDTHLIISGSDISGKGALWKSAKAQSFTEEFNEPKPWDAEKDTRRNFEARLKEQSIKFSPAAIEQFIERVGFESRLQENEIDKILLYIGEAKTLTADDVKLLTAQTRETAVWDFTEALASMNLNAVLEILRDYEQQREPAIKLMYFIENNLQLLILMRICHDRGWAKVERQGYRTTVNWAPSPDGEKFLMSLKNDPRKGSDFRLAKTLAQASKLPLRLLVYWLNKVVDTHESLISSSTPEYVLLEIMAMDMLTAAKPRKKAS